MKKQYNEKICIYIYIIYFIILDFGINMSELLTASMMMTSKKFKTKSKMKDFN